MTEKKKYEAPEMKAYQVKPASIICTSTLNLQNETEILVEEEYNW